MGPFLLLVLFGIAGLATWLALKAKQAPPATAPDHTQGGKYSLLHPTVPQPAKLADGTGDTAAPPFAPLALRAPTAIDFGTHDPPIPTASYDLPAISENVEMRVEQLGHAIAKAEGFGIPGTLPTRARNPGDMKLGDIGNGLLNGKTIFATAQDGWIALFNQIRRIIAGNSRYYTVDDSFSQMAATWTGNDSPQSWANTVTAELRVSQSTTLRSFLGV